MKPRPSSSSLGSLPLVPRRPTWDGSSIPGFAGTLHPIHTPSAIPLLTPAGSGELMLTHESIQLASDSTDSQTDSSREALGSLVSAGDNSGQPDSAGPTSEVAAAVYQEQTVTAAIGHATDTTVAGKGIPTRAPQGKGTPAPKASAATSVKGVPSFQAPGVPSHAQGVPNLGLTCPRAPSVKDIPNCGLPGAIVAFATQGMPGPQVSIEVGAAESIPNLGLGRAVVAYPMYGLARAQNQRASMEDRDDVQSLDVPGGRAHMYAVRAILCRSLT